MTGVCVSTHEQEEIACAERSRQGGADSGMTIYTGICLFISAKKSGQKALLQQLAPDVFSALNLRRKCDIVESWAAARLNGYVSGYGSAEQCRQEWQQFGITDHTLLAKVMQNCR
eukprot:scpid98823/ scgid24393/ 